MKRKLFARQNINSNTRTHALSGYQVAGTLVDSKGFLVSVMNKKDKWVFRGLLSLWLISLALFWGWWLEENHVVGNIRFLINSAILAWTTILPGYYFYFVSKMKKTNPSLYPQVVELFSSIYRRYVA